MKLEKLNFEKIFFSAFGGKLYNDLPEKEKKRERLIAKTIFNRIIYELLN